MGDSIWSLTEQRKMKKKASKRKQKETTVRKKKKPRLLLNEAMKDVDKQKGWSLARKNAWKKKDERPNGYYYRFNGVGEENRKGPWSEAEMKKYFDRVEDIGVNVEWGIFSKTITGRCGYMCSGLWRTLIADGLVKDLNYRTRSKKPEFIRQNEHKKLTKEEKKKIKRFGFIIKTDPREQATPWCHSEAPDAIKAKVVEMRKEKLEKITMRMGLEKEKLSEKRKLELLKESENPKKNNTLLCLFTLVSVGLLEPKEATEISERKPRKNNKPNSLILKLINHIKKENVSLKCAKELFESGVLREKEFEKIFNQLKF